MNFTLGEKNTPNKTHFIQKSQYCSNSNEFDNCSPSIILKNGMRPFTNT